MDATKSPPITIKNISHVVAVIREVEPLLRKANCLVYDRHGVARLTNKFYESYLADTPPNLVAYSKPVLGDNVQIEKVAEQSESVVAYGRFKVTIPHGVAKVKSLYREAGYAGSYKTIGKQIESVGKELYRSALSLVFKEYAPRKIQKQDGAKMVVGAFANEEGEKFGHIVSSPTVDYALLLLAIAYAYTGDRVGMSTCTMTRFVMEDRWVGYYDEMKDMQEDGSLHLLFPPLDKSGNGMGMELA